METEEEKTRRKEEEEWQARFQDEWTDEVGGMWGENTTWNDQGNIRPKSLWSQVVFNIGAGCAFWWVFFFANQ